MTDIGFQVGDILRGSYGYDATFYDFYKVIKVTPASVRLVPLKKAISEGPWQTVDSVVPTDEVSGDPFTRKVKNYGEPFVKITSSEWAKKWDGEVALQSAMGTY